MAIACTSCSQSIPEDGDRLPPWCPQCGADLKALPPNPDAARDRSCEQGPVEPTAAAPAGQRFRWVLIVLSVAAGLTATVMVFRLGRERPPPPPPPIVRETYSVQAPYRAWEIDEARQRADGADLVLSAQRRGGGRLYFSVHVARPEADPPTPDRLIEELKKEWQAGMQPCHFLEGAGGPALLAGQPAERVVAVGWVGGAKRRREATVLVYQGVGYRLTCEADDVLLDGRRSTARAHFSQLLTSFSLADEPDADGP